MHDERSAPLSRHGQCDVRLSRADVVGEQAATLASKVRAHAAHRLDLIGAEDDRAQRSRWSIERDGGGERRAGRVESVARVVRASSHGRWLHASSGATSLCFSRYAVHTTSSSAGALGGSWRIARSATGARIDRARGQSCGSGRSATVQARYRCQPPRAGSAIAPSHAAASGEFRSAAIASASSGSRHART